MNAKQRRRLRERSEHQTAMRVLKSKGARCGNCQHFATKWDSRTGYQCELGQEGGGIYQPAEPFDLCTSHKRKL